MSKGAPFCTNSDAGEHRDERYGRHRNHRRERDDLRHERIGDLVVEQSDHRHHTARRRSDDNEAASEDVGIRDEELHRKENGDRQHHSLEEGVDERAAPSSHRSS